MNKIDSYLAGIYIREDIQDTLKDYKKVDKQFFVGNIKKAVNPDDPKGSLTRIAKVVPSGFNGKTALAKIDKVLGSIDEYSKLQSRATTIIKNSITGVSSQMAEAAGTFLVFHSMFAKKGKENIPVDQNLKVNLKIFVTKVRNFGEDYNEDKEEKRKLRPGDYADLSVAWVIIVMSSSLAIGIAAGIYVALKIVALAFAATLPMMMNLFTYTICGIIIFVVFTLIASKMG